MLEIAEGAAASLNTILVQPILPIMVTEEINRLFDSHTDEEIIKICVFSKNEILDLYEFLRPSFAKFHSRGRKPHFSNVDSIVVFLFYMSSGTSSDKLSGVLSVSTDTIHNTLERIGAVLYDGCAGQLLTDPPKARVSPTYCQNVGILVDSTYVPVPRVLDDYEVGKLLWDEHHKVYALKKQVCIQAGPPYLAIYSAPYALGSTADVEILKKTAEKISLHAVTATGICAVMGDKGYITRTPLPFQMITPKKVNMHSYSPAENTRIATARIYVEQFFGRMKCSWKILSTKYRRAHKHFDRDFDILVALTNRLILCRPPPTEAENIRHVRVHKSLKHQYLVEFLRKKARVSMTQALSLFAAEVEAAVPTTTASAAAVPTIAAERIAGAAGTVEFNYAESEETDEGSNDDSDEIN